MAGRRLAGAASLVLVCVTIVGKVAFAKLLKLQVSDQSQELAALNDEDIRQEIPEMMSFSLSVSCTNNI